MAAKKEKTEMSFMDHLEDLRWMLIRSTIVIIVMSCVAWHFDDFVFNTVIFGPKDPNFVTYEFFCQVAKLFGEDGSCATEFAFTIQSTEVGGQFDFYMWTCIWAGFIMSFPFILWEIWKFIRPALYEKERKNARAFILISSLLFFIGVLFGYFIIIPLSVNFFGTFSASTVIENRFSISSYVSMIKTSAIVSGLVFELPIFIYFLTKLGLVTPTFLRKYRKISIVVILIVAAIVTPPDVSAQVIVSIPILILYEASIWISVLVLKSKKKEDERISTGV